MRKVAVMGDYDSIYGFSALGIDIYPVKEKDEAKATLKKLVVGDYAIIYIVESVAKDLTEEIDKHKESISPAIIQIPGISGNTGAGIAQVKSFVEQAVGSDILFGDE
ncbi:MAG: V-type ATP synthase subunit F [Eubacterium sp.]|nr:V-type ATP synthase subunit F [Eubacterium sp.]